MEGQAPKRAVSLRMFNSNKQKSVVGLDIEAGSVAATEVRANGSIEVLRTGIARLEPGTFREGEIADPEALSEALKELFSEHGLGKSVRLGIANQRVAVRTLHLPVIEDRDELETAVRFQAQDHIPMPLDQAVLDFEVTARTPGENGDRRMEVVAVAARRDMITSMVTALREAGLRPIGIDLSAFGMIRAFAHAGVVPAVEPAAPAYEDRAPVDGPDAAGGATAPAPAMLYCNLGDVTNLAVARGPACLFTRISQFGVEGIAQRLAERRGLTLEHARQWMGHVGLDRPLEEIEGDPDTVSATREALAEGVAKLADELRLSLEYYRSSEGAANVEGVIACGPGSTIPGLPERLERELGQRFVVARPPALSHLDEPSAARLTLSFGLALEE
jgi:type IV pilus assembly protein PilM